MTTVSVDLADLEKLVFVTGAIKAIESALDQRKRDPFVIQHLDFSDAHNRLASAMRNAQRGNAGTLINYNEPLTEEELELLKKVEPGFWITKKQKAPLRGQEMSIWDRIMCKGYIEIGQVVSGAIFAGSTQVESVVADPDCFAVRLTARGRALLAK